MSEETDSEKYEAMKQLNEHWQKAHDMAPGPKRDRYMAVVKKVSEAVAKSYDAPMSGEGPIDTIGHGALKALDYGAGLVRAPILAGAEAVAGPSGKWQDVLKAAVDPRRPGYTGGEVLKDIGVPEGGHLSDVIPGYAPAGTPGLWPPNKGGPLDPSARGTAGAAYDFLASPYGVRGLMGSAENKLAGLSAQEIQSIERAAREARLTGPTLMDRVKGVGSFAADPLNATMGASGRGMYNSAFGQADKASIDAGAKPISDILYRNNVWGTPSSLASQAKDVTERIGKSVGEDVTQAAKKPMAIPRINITSAADASLNKSMGIAGQSIGALEAADRLANEFDLAYGNMKFRGSTKAFDINELQDIKQSMQAKAAQQRAYLNEPPNPSRGAHAADSMVEAAQMGKAYKETGKAARRAVEDLADEAEPGLGGKIYQKNSDLASLYEGQDALDKSANQSLGTSWHKNWPSAMAGGVLGGGMGYGAGHDPYAMAIGAAAGGMASSDLFRTGAGLAVGKSAPWASNAIRTYMEQKYNPWIREHKPFDVGQ